MKRNPISMLATSVLVGMALSTGSIAAGSAEIDILRELDARARHRNGPTPHSISGQLKIPTKIVLALVLFRGDKAAYTVEANFRYRVKDGKLTMWYELIRPHVYLEDAVRQIAETISAGINCGLMLDATT